MTALPARIADLVPHAGAMVLLDTVERWDEVGLVSTTSCHLREDNPLRAHGVLPAAAGVELGAQATAIHGALLAGGESQAGLLVAIADLGLAVDRIDDVPGPLRITVALEHGSVRGRIYRFDVSGGGAELVSGRLTVMRAG